MRRFLYIIVIAVVLVGVVLFGLRMYSRELTEIALVPSGEFVEQDQLADSAYASPAMWFSRPGIGAINDPARWQPAYLAVAEAVEGQTSKEELPAPQPDPATEPPSATDEAEPPRFAVFFVHPTSYLDNSSWNAALDDERSQELAQIMVRGMASAFNQASEIWVPRYRQATFGAFLSDSEEAGQAIDAAYRDVDLAFDYFLASVDADMPIVLAGHSQGALHVLRLLRERVAGSELQSRVAMAYPIGWPISIEHDLPQLPLPACATPAQAGCIVTWSSFAEPADPSMMLANYAASPGLDGEIRGDSPILCVNPLSGTLGDAAPMSANLGTLVPTEDLSSGGLVAGAVPARCDDGGLLLIGDPPQLGSYVLPFNNYHVYDIPLFWQNLQQDVVRRVDSWTQGR